MARKARVTQYKQGHADASKIALLVLKLTVDAYPRSLSDSVIEQLGECAPLCVEFYDELERFKTRLVEEKLIERRSRKATRTGAPEVFAQEKGTE